MDDSYVMAEESVPSSAPEPDQTEEGFMTTDELIVPPDETTNQPTKTTSKTHLCFNHHFDMRVGAVFINSVNIFVRILALLFSFAWGVFFPIPTDLASIVWSAVAIAGALNFEYIATGLASLGFLAITIFHILFHSSVFGILFDALLIYPTAMITFEIYKGVMAADDYEEYIDPEITQVANGLIEGAAGLKERFHVELGKIQQSGNASVDGTLESDYVNIDTDALPKASSGQVSSSLA